MERVHSYASCLCTFCTLDCCIWRVPKVRSVQNRSIVKPGCPSVGGGASMPDCCQPCVKWQVREWWEVCMMCGCSWMHFTWLCEDSSCVDCWLRWILSVITAGVWWSGLQLVLAWGLIRLDLSKDYNLAITVRRPLKWLVMGWKERWSCWESNPGPLAYLASALALSYNSLQQPPHAYRILGGLWPIQYLVCMCLLTWTGPASVLVIPLSCSTLWRWHDHLPSNPYCGQCAVYHLAHDCVKSLVWRFMLAFLLCEWIFLWRRC